MRPLHALRAITLLLIVLAAVPLQVKAAATPSWMTPATSASYLVKVRNTPNEPTIAYANWTITGVNNTSNRVTMREEGLLGFLGSLAVSLLSSGSVSLLSAQVVISIDYNITARTCSRPCPAFNLTTEYAWEWIPSNINATLQGGYVYILHTVFYVQANETLSPYNRTAWRLVPLVQVYQPNVILGNFWYDRDSGILLRADLFSQGDGNLTMQMQGASPSFGIAGFASPISPMELLLLTIVTALFSLMITRGPLKRRN